MTTERKIPERLSATLALDEPVTSIPGVREARGKLLAEMGMLTVRDVLGHFPAKYLDMTKVRTSATAQIGEQCTMAGLVHEVKLKRPKRNLSIFEITLTDEDGTFIVSVFNRPYLANVIMRGSKLIVAGKVEFNYGFLRISNPYIEIYEGGEVHGKIIPVHHATTKLTTAKIRTIVKGALENCTGLLDPLPASIRQKRGLVSKQHALRSIHFPATMEEVSFSRNRLAYEELLYLQLFLMMETRSMSDSRSALAHTIDGEKLASLYYSLPFELTREQKVAIGELLDTMSKDRASSRMLLGDVGTGKTIVAAFGMAAAADSGGQAIMLAPTEVLAAQHDQSLGAFFDQVGISHALLSGSTSPADREDILERFATGKIDVLIGTHAVLEDDVKGSNVSFVVVDEQQRFGVGQREKALSKGPGADSLFMTATPIPRTLALTLFGGMELSYIHDRPHKFSDRKTKVLDYSQRGIAFDQAREALYEGHQVYVVCPLIGSAEDDEGENDNENKSQNDRPGIPEEDYLVDDILIEDELDYSIGSLKAAEQEAQLLQNQIFAGYNVGLLHGNMTSEAKAKVMSDFRNGEIDVLVATTVIEVGVDVPNASVMIIEDAERFGLSQLHQLRGRVGRGSGDAQVFLISSSMHPKALKRLKAMEASEDGFKIAQFDLSLRREGDILGNRQSGTSSLKLVNLDRDSELVQYAHEDAKEILDADPLLEMKEHAALAREVRIIFKNEHSRHGG